MESVDPTSDVTSLDTCDFTTALSEPQILDLKQQLERFIVHQHEVCLRPICLVSSGGTAVDLEVNSVRCLDNFSTGLRGAISVEEFLKRGYSVIHLQREGSASPFARVLSQYLGLKQSNYGLTTESLGKLFSLTGDSLTGEESDDAIMQTVLDQDKDPWMTNVEKNQRVNVSTHDSDTISLCRGVLNSFTLRKALKEQSDAMREGRLLTVQFRTVEEYLLKLKTCAQTLSITQSLAMFFLAAAVSDFYIPNTDKSLHKIQTESSADEITLNLKPVPKVLGDLRRSWAPDAFVVSFKLETDIDILRQKSMRSVEKYGCHLVIGNLLQSRHDKVWILSPEDFRNKSPSSANDWLLMEICKDRLSDADSLESTIIDTVVESHFEFISWHYNSRGFAIKQLQCAKDKLSEDKKTEQKILFWRKAKGVALEVVGGVLTFLISYLINSTFQRRHQSLTRES
jgi:phosphopantothenate---cysteine ligase (ATP)